MSQVYADDTVMAEWKLNMDSINENCISDLEGIEGAIKKLDDSLRGDYAEQYESSITNFIKNAKTSHENLRDVENFLDQIVDVMKNQ